MLYFVKYTTVIRSLAIWKFHDSAIVSTDAPHWIEKTKRKGTYLQRQKYSRAYFIFELIQNVDGSIEVWKLVKFR
jgi:hypothetical protein